MTPGNRRGDTGTTLVLVIFYGVFALGLVLLVTAATSLSIERKRLFTIADGAALAGAESFTLAAVQAGAHGVAASLTDAEVQLAVADYLDAVQDGALEGIRVEGAHSPDGHSAEVTLSTLWLPPVLTAVLPGGIRLEATATARSVLR